jgi:hypothetical protein
MDGPRFRWFLPDEVQRHGTKPLTEGQPYETLYRLPDDTWVLSSAVDDGMGGEQTEAQVLTDDEALAWLEEYVFDKRKPVPEPYRAMADARHVGAALGDGGKASSSGECAAPPLGKRQAPLDPTTADETTTPTAPDRSDQNRKRKRINERMMEMLALDGTRIGWSARQWAEVLKCSKSTVVETHTWKVTIRSAMALREAENLRRKSHEPTDRRRFPKKRPKND